MWALLAGIPAKLCLAGAQCCQLMLMMQVSVPERVGDHEYFVQQLPGRPHPCYMRRRVAEDGAADAAEGRAWQQHLHQQHQEKRQEQQQGQLQQGLGADVAGAEVVLDVNELAAVHGEYVQVGQVSLVPAHLPACM